MSLSAKKKSTHTPKQSYELVVGKSYTGVVTHVDLYGRVCNLQVASTSHPLTGCLVAIGVISGLLGFRTNYMPPLGARVKFIYGSPSVIYAGMPSDPVDLSQAGGRVLTGTGFTFDDMSSSLPDANVHEGRTFTPNEDQLEGEYDMTNLLGVGISLLTTLSMVKAGDLAKVECHLLNDMVRIVSKNFKHFSSFGDQQIYDDGRLNFRFDGTSYPHEAFGKLNPNDPKLPLEAKTQIDFTSIQSVTDTGRWRFSNYMGFLGDFIHTFVTDPTTQLGSIAAASVRAGKFSAHVNSDGTLLVQSVAEIALERVCRVVVPIEVKRSDDQTGVTPSDFEALDSKFLKSWNYQGQNLIDNAYQLREYARWLSGFHSLARFHQLEAKKGEWKVPDEASSPVPEWTSKEKDKQDANGSSPTSYDTYSTIRIMRDGSQVMWNGYGSVVSMIGPDVHVSAVRHLRLEAAGDIQMVAGQNVYIKARRSMELVAQFGGLTLKAKAWLHGLSELGSLWLKSDAPDPNAPGYTPLTQSDLTFPTEDPLPLVLDHAVLLDASVGRFMAQSAQRATLQTTGAPTATLGSADVCVQSMQGGVDSLARLDVSTSSLTGNIRFRTTQSILVAAKSFVNALSGFFGINSAFGVTGGTTSCLNLKGGVVSADTVMMGPKTGPSDLEDSTIPLRGHFNHILENVGDRAPVLPDPSTAQALFSDTTLIPKSDFSKGAPTWDFQPTSDYVHNAERNYESLAQQRIRTDATLANTYTAWTPASMDVFISKTRNGQNLPYPGRGSNQWQHTSGEDLGKPSSIPYNSLGQQTPLANSPITFQFFKRG